MRWRAALALALLQAAGACAPAPAPATPERPTVVSLNPCADAILAELAGPERVLGISAYSHDPAASSMDQAQARRFHAVSGSVEELLALAPDVVVGDAFTPPATIAALARAGIAFERLPMAATVADSAAQVRAMAALVQQAERGDALNRHIDAALDRAAPPPGMSHLSAIVWQSGGLVAGDGALISDLLERTGWRNAAAARGLGQGAVLGLEAVLANPPGALLVAGNPEAADQLALRHPTLRSLPETYRATLAPNLLFCGGPTIPRLASRLADIRRDLRGI